MITIIIGAVATFVFGYLWYGPVFGKQWMKLMNMTSEGMERAKQGGMAGKMTVMGVTTIITAWAVYYILPHTLPNPVPLSFGQFFKFIFVIWLGFGFPVQLGAYLWEGKSWKLVAFNAAESVLSFLILSAIIFFWR